MRKSLPRSSEALSWTSRDSDANLLSRELKNEARRIKFFDFDIRLEDPATFKEPDLNLDMDSLDSDILASITYAAASPFGVRAPRNLTEEVGIFISDGLVPVSLHREVRKDSIQLIYL
jgi:hypothetical protein